MKSRWALAVAVAMSATLVFGGNAHAIMPFLDAFKATYKDNAELLKAVEEQKCNVCHIQGKGKKEKNAFGIAVHDAGAEKKMAEEFKNNKEDATKKFAEILKKAEDKKSASGKTFGELIKEGKLPGA